MKIKMAKNLIKIIRNLKILKKEKINSINTKINKIQTKKIPSTPRNGKKKFNENRKTFTISLVASKPMMKRTILKVKDKSNGLNHAKKIRTKPIKSLNHLIKSNLFLLDFIT